MRHRYTIVLIVLHLLSSLSLLAQERSSTGWLWWRSDSLIYQTTESSGISSLLALQQALLPSSIAFDLSGGSFTPVHQPAIPRSGSNWSLKANGGYRYGNLSLRGEVQYGRGFNRKLSHALTSDPELFYPYLVSDTIPKNHTSEIYSFGFHASYRPLNWLSVGVQAGYRGEVRYSRQDPRVHNTISTPYGGLSLTFAPKEWGYLSLSGIYYSYKQHLHFNVLKDTSTEQIYILRPFGMFNHRYSGRESNGDYRYLRPNYRVDLNWLLPKQELQVGIKYQASQSRLHTTKAGVYYNELNTQEITPYLYTKVLGWRAHHNLSLRADYTYDPRRDLERSYQTVRVGPKGVLTQQELIAEIPSYRETWHKWQGALIYKYQSKRFKTEAEVAYGGFTLITKSLRDENSGQYGVHYIAPKLIFSWLGNGNRAIYGSVNIASHHQLHVTNHTTLNHEQKTKVIEESIRSYQLGAKHKITIASDLYLPLRGDKALGLSLQVTPSIWAEQQMILYSSGTLSYIF